MISCFRGRLLLFGGLRGKVKLAANSNSDLYCQDGVQFRKERRLLHHRWRGGVQNRLYGSDGADKGVQSLIVRNAVLRSPDEEQHPHQDVRSMLSLDESPTSPETPFYKTRGNFRLNALEEAFLTFRSQSDRYPWTRVEPPDKLMVAMSRDLKSASSEGDRRRLVDKSLDRGDWRDVGSEELIKAWKAVVCYSTSVPESIYWDDPRVTSLVSEIGHRAHREFDDSQLTESVRLFSMRHNYFRTPKVLMRLESDLDSACCTRFRREVKFRMRPERRAFYLHLAMLWLKCSEVSCHAGKAWFNKFIVSLVESQLSRDSVEELDTAELTFVIFLCWKLRVLPIKSSDRTHLIKGKLLSVLDELSPYELHVILTTFRRCDVRILDNMWQVTERLFDILMRTPTQKAVQNEWMIATLAKTLKLSVKDRAKKQAFADKFGDILELFSPHVCIHLLAMLSYNVPARHEAFLEKFCSATESQWRRMRSKDLGKIAFAMYTMNYGDRSRLEGLSNALSKVKRWHARSTLDVVHALSLLSEMGVYNEELIGELIEAANSYAPLKNATSEDEICDAAHDLSLQLCQPPKVVGENTKRFEMGRNPLSPMALLYNIANIDCNVELSGRSMPRMEPGLRDKMLSLSGVTPKAIRKKRPLFRKPGEDGKLQVPGPTGPSESEQVREKVVELALKTFGRDVMYCLPYPTARFPDILCCLRSTVAKDPSFKQARMGIKTVPIPEGFTEDRLRSEFAWPPAVPGGTWFAIVVAKYRDHFDGAGRPTGALRSKQRMLESLGYRVVTVDRGLGLMQKGYDLQAERPGKYKRVHLVEQVIEAWGDEEEQ